MSKEPIQIKRYPNRRYYARHTSRYVSLQEIEEMIAAGETVEIRDSQSGEDLTRAVLTQIIIERQPEKMLLFPTDMLHFILRSNDMMTDFLRDYFRQSLTYLNYLQQHSATASALTRPVHWVKAWLDGLAPAVAADPASKEQARAEAAGAALDKVAEAGTEAGAEKAAEMAARVEQLEDRIRQLEARENAKQ